MKTCFLFLTLLLFLPNGIFASASEPDSAYIFAYATEKNGGRNGLHIAWSIDGKSWRGIGPEHSFLYSDYGTWGGEKRMFTPYLFHAADGIWHAVWSVNDRDGAFAHATSPDLINWRPQSYPIVSDGKNVLRPDLSFDNKAGQFVVSWASDEGNGQRFYSARTTNFEHCDIGQSTPLAARPDLRREMRIGATPQTGTLHRVTWALVERLIEAYQLESYQNQLDRETTDQDPVRFKDLQKVEATILVEGANQKAISKELIGVFFEDINCAADGGLYAELLQNRGFEYQASDKGGRDSTWTALKAWRIEGKGAGVSIETENPLHPNNPHHAILRIDKVGAGLVNEGWDGIPVRAGETYDLSLFARYPGGGNTTLDATLVGKNGEVLGKTSIAVSSGEWRQYRAEIRADKTAADAHLMLTPRAVGNMALDMVSLFPRKTFMGRRNGLRADLAQTIADIKPQFVRFPGGCVAHGNGLENMYRWKDTIGPLEARKPQRNIWNYHQSYGLGYYEYFQFCEDIGAQPIPIVPAGVPCQNSSVGGAGQQCGIPMSEMDNYVQEVLDLIEWANGDPGTTWGKKRAEAGHPQPFNLKYLGVGNEDLITEIFKERFQMIYEAVKAKHPEIIVIGTVGPFFKGSDYEEGWRFANQLNIPIVDEHYYRPPGWFIHNQDYYDKYDRSKSKVYLGEYAGHLPGRPVNIETALSEALYLTAVERNGDVVRMASYAPLLAKEGNTQWRPDLIYFNNSTVKPTVGYQVQKLFGNNAGDTYIASTVSLSEERDAVGKRVGVSVVRDGKSKDVILKLVNLLPVAVDAAITLEGLGSFRPKAVETVLSGHPDDEEAKPRSGEFDLKERFRKTLPAYSLSVIRCRAAKGD